MQNQILTTIEESALLSWPSRQNLQQDVNIISGLNIVAAISLRKLVQLLLHDSISYLLMRARWCQQSSSINIDQDADKVVGGSFSTSIKDTSIDPFYFPFPTSFSFQRSFLLLLLLIVLFIEAWEPWDMLLLHYQTWKEQRHSCKSLSS